MRLIIATVVKLSIVVTIEKALKNQYENLLNVFFLWKGGADIYIMSFFAK